MITLTFDNLGEATALERGTWDGATPLGADPSVTVALPRLLDELDRHSLRATFCVEAINCGLNPDAVTGIAARGHEVAVHGWRHEPWAQLAPDRERELLRRSREAFAALGLHPAGFRPPGGEPAAGDPGILAEHGFAWCSPVATEAIDDAAPGRDAITSVPFSWDLVDAYLLMDSFSELRVRRGDAPNPLDPTSAAARLRARLVDAAGPHTLVMHPFLMLQEAWWTQTRELLEFLAERVAAGQAECVTAGEAARRR